MSLIDEAKKLKPGDFALAIGLFVSVIAPGFLTLYLYKPTLVHSLDTFKLLLFSAALTLPIVVVNHFVASQLKGFENDHPVAAGFAMTMTCAVFYIALLISYFASLRFVWYVAIVIGIEMLLVILLNIAEKHEAKKP